jgi:hypothetical protein
MSHFDTTILQALIDAHDPKYRFRPILRSRLSVEGGTPFLDPLSSEEVRWINNQLDPHRSRAVSEPSFTVSNLYEYVDLLNRFIGVDEYYREILKEFEYRCTPEQLSRLQERLNRQRAATDGAWQILSKRRERSEWSQAEMEALDVAVADLGYNWRAIKSKYPQLSARTSGMQLRDKCLQIKRRAAKEGRDLREFKGGIYSEPIPGKEVGQIARMSRKRRSRAR